MNDRHPPVRVEYQDRVAVVTLASESSLNPPTDELGRNWDAIRAHRKPLIAPVRGYALGGGCKPAMMCDAVVAAEDARFGQPEVVLGMRCRGASPSEGLLFERHQFHTGFALKDRKEDIAAFRERRDPAFAGE